MLNLIREINQTTWKNIRRTLTPELVASLESIEYEKKQKNYDYYEWLGNNMIGFIDEYVSNRNLLNTHFIITLNSVFRTRRFDLFLKKWLIQYLFSLFNIMDSFPEGKPLTLKDDPLNRFAAEKFISYFKKGLKIKWKRGAPFLSKLFLFLIFPCFVMILSLKNGVKLYGKKKKFKVMREAIWGLPDFKNHFYHDDFMVDGEIIKKEDLLLYSRGVPVEKGRLKGYHDAQRSGYSHFVLGKQPIMLGTLLFKIIPKYIVIIVSSFLFRLFTKDFDLFYAIAYDFTYNAIPYEAVFSNYSVTSELGHNYFCPSHIAESIICQNYHTSYYLFHWSDISVKEINYIAAFLGCDKFLLWGKAHLQGRHLDSSGNLPIGYLFKRFVKQVQASRKKYLAEMEIKPQNKIISFYDESFGWGCEMTEDHFMAFWEMILKVVENEKSHTILIKQKISKNYPFENELNEKRFIEIKEHLKKERNVYLINPDKWTFIETIGVSDLVVTQGMTSSATIAIVCDIKGLYFDQYGYDHKFSKLFWNKIVFKDSDKIILEIHGILAKNDLPLKKIPEPLRREYDAYADDRGIDLLRLILAKGEKN